MCIPHLPRIFDPIRRDAGRVPPIALLKQRQLQALRVDTQLLDGARTEGVARAEHRSEAIRLEIVRNLREARRLADAVDADEDDRVRPLLRACGRRGREQIDALIRREHAR